MSDITITVSGPIKSGKSTILRLLRDALRKHDIDVEYADVVTSEEVENVGRCRAEGVTLPQHLADRLRVAKPSVQLHERPTRVI